MNPKIIQTVTLACAGGGCCPDASVNTDRSVTLTEGAFSLVLSEDSAKALAHLLEKHGYK